jgi:hypothetical protein
MEMKMTVRPEEEEISLRAPTDVIADYIRRSISLSYLLGLVLSGYLIVIAATLMGLLWGIYTVHREGPSYTATMRISPAPGDMGDMSAAGGLLAGLTGGATSATQVPKFIQFTYALDSVEVARILDQKYDLLCRVYRGECDPVTHQWKDRHGLVAWLGSTTSRLSGLPDPNIGPRNAIDLALYIGATVSVTQIKKTDSVNTLAFVHRNPEFAAQFLSLVVKTTNDYIRAQNRETQKRYVEYLSASAAKTTNVEQRQAIDTLLLQEERQLMKTEVDIPYAATILDGPTVTPVNKALKTIAIYTILGLFLGMAITMSRDLLPRRWRFW